MKNKKLIRYKNLKVSKNLETKYIKVFSKFIKSGQYLPSKFVKKFEGEISNYCKRKYCVGLSSGTNALYLGLKAAGIKKGDEVICPAISWIATANAIAMTGARPVFVDIKLDQTICPLSVAKAINKKTKAIMIVHFTGLLADYDTIRKIVKNKKILIIEDAAQAFGAKYKKRRAGNFGDISALSFNPMKVLKGFGEAGAVLCDSKKIYDKIIELRHLGTSAKNPDVCNYIELNHKIDELQAGLLLESLKNFRPEANIRKKLILNYTKKLKSFCIFSDHNVSRSSGYDYQILIKNRDKLKQYLESKNIETRIKHSVLMCEQKMFSNEKIMNIKNAKMISKHSLSLPLHKRLSFAEQRRVISEIKQFYKKIN